MSAYRYALAAIVLAATSSPCWAQASDEAQKQATRLISQAISERVSRTVDLGALQGSDDRAGKSQSVWALGSYTDLGIGGSNFADLYLATGGYDTRNDKLTYGISGSYARTQLHLGGLGLPAGTVSSGIDTVTVSPYAAYQTSAHTFVSGIFNVSHSFVGGSGDSTSGSVEMAFNAFSRGEKATVRGKVAYRGGFGIDPGSDLFSTLVVAGEGEVALSPKASIYLNAEANMGLDDKSDVIQTYAGTGMVRYAW